MRTVSLHIISAIIFCSLASLTIAADTLIYDNSTYQGYYPFYSNDLTAVYDYGTSSGGLVKKISFGYRNISYTTNLRISFYASPYVYDLDLGYHIKTIEINNLPPSAGSFYNYTLPENDRFTLPNGSFGFSIAVSDNSTSLAIAYGNTGNPDELWVYAYDWPWDWDWYVFGFSDAWDSLYMKIWTGPPINEITCDISGNKFNDTNGNGIWNAGEAGLSGWDIYLDTNNDGIHDASEPNVRTDPNGFYFFENKPSPATYRIREIIKPGWTQTLPGASESYQYQVTTEPNHLYGPYNFGNTQAVIKYGGGSGTAADPYIINTAAHLVALSNTSADWSKYFIQTADINMTGYSFTKAVIAPDTDNSTEYFQGTSFTGVFDGNGKIISNLNIAGTGYDYIGLFGKITSGQIKKLGLANASIQGRSYIGGLAGNNSGGVITYCYSTGTITGTGQNIGGLVGSNDYSISSCYSMATISGSGTYVGGLAGNNSQTISTCYAAGGVSGTRFVGGLIGYSSIRIITSSFWDVQTSNQAGSAAGKGLTTSQMKTLSVYQNADWTSKGWIINNGSDYPRLNWENTAGTTIPAAVLPFTGSGTTNNPYRISTPQEFALLSWYSDVLNKQIRLEVNLDLSGITLYPIGDLGRFSGTFDGNGHTISNAVIYQPGSDYVGLFETLNGQVKNLGVTNINVQGRNCVGGLTGISYYSNPIDSCYVTGSVSGESEVGGLIGRNLFSPITSCYVQGVITGFDDVGGLTGICMSGLTTSCHAAGSVSGNSTVGGLVGDNWQGSFTSCYATGSVSGTNSTGGLIGMNYQGSIASCYATGSVTGNYGTGGLAGENSDSSIISCYATGSVIGEDVTGGLSGSNYGDGIIATSYSTGNVNGQFIVGGLTGTNHAKIIHCYSSGRPQGSSYVGGLCGVITVDTGYQDTGNFWDTQTSHIFTSAMGTGKTTAEMKTLTTFTGAAWDFVGETANGTQDIWRMCTGTSYPKFAWQTSTPGDFVCPEGVDPLDLDIFMDQWLLHTNVVSNIVKDDVVNLLDWQKLASAWMTSTGQAKWNPDCDIAPVGGDGQINQLDLMVMSEQWLEYEAWNADIAPAGGDGFVNLLDFEVFASNWLLTQ